MLPIKEEDLIQILPDNGPSISEVKQYLEKYNDEYIVIKCGGSVLVDDKLFNIFIMTLLESTLHKNKIAKAITLFSKNYDLYILFGCRLFNQFFFYIFVKDCKSSIALLGRFISDMF